MGRRHRPFFRIHAMDVRNPRNGTVLEKLGHYDPLEKDTSKQYVLDLERIKYWLECGAIPSDPMCDILRRNGLTCKYMEDRKRRTDRSRELVRKAGKPYTKIEKLALTAPKEQKAEG
jgi:small subunit ribosomal protein S16